MECDGKIHLISAAWWRILGKNAKANLRGWFFRSFEGRDVNVRLTNDVCNFGGVECWISERQTRKFHAGNSNHVDLDFECHNLMNRARSWITSQLSSVTLEIYEVQFSLGGTLNSLVSLPKCCSRSRFLRLVKRCSGEVSNIFHHLHNPLMWIANAWNVQWINNKP